MYMYYVYTLQGCNAAGSGVSMGENYIMIFLIFESSCRDLSIKALQAPPLADAVSI
jgi:hypothetical protein